MVMNSWLLGIIALVLCSASFVLGTVAGAVITMRYVYVKGLQWAPIQKAERVAAAAQEMAQEAQEEESNE